MPEAPDITGLTDDEVAERVSRGLTNADADVKTKTVGQILSEHILTLFNLVNVVMAGLVAITGQWENMLFMGVVVANVVVGVFQEIRAKRKVDELAILAAKPVRARREGRDVEVGSGELVRDDVVLLSSGEQVPADAEVVWGSATFDESLLTGEADRIPKGPGDALYSGSFVETGAVVARLTKVGAESYAARINAEAKYVKPVRSEIRSTLDWIISLATRLLAPLGALLFLRTLLMDGSTLDAAILSTVSAVIGMIPQGLVLLTSTVLAVATTRLAMRRVLVQQSYCVETLARVDVLCLDKTGTITSGNMEVSLVSGPGCALAAVSVAAANAADANETARAVLAYGRRAGIEPLPAIRAVPFSSATKLSGCVCADGRALVMGAAQFVLGHAVEPPGGASELDRVLVTAEVDGFDGDGRPLGEARLLGCVCIRDELRPSARETVAYFQEQGVSLKVISGDDPRTVSAIAAEAGVAGASSWVDATTLETPEAVREAAGRHVVFGRVTPAQKRELVRALRGRGHVVAMTGDGVNDVLALKEADCSVSMASGSAAARNVSEVVLADDDFSHMPEVVAEGRRSINNLQRSASLFLVKTVYAAALAVVCILLPPYPFIPIQMSLISFAVIGMPSFVLALEPNHERVSGSFLANVLARSLPASAAITAGLFVAICVGRGLGLTFEQVSTVCTLVVCLVGVALIARVSWPPTPIRAVLIILCAAAPILGCTVFAWFYRFATFSAPIVVLVLVVGACALALFWRLYDVALADLASEGPLFASIVRLEEKHAKRDS